MYDETPSHFVVWPDFNLGQNQSVILEILGNKCSAPFGEIPVQHKALSGRRVLKNCTVKTSNNF